MYSKPLPREHVQDVSALMNKLNDAVRDLQLEDSFATGLENVMSVSRALHNIVLANRSIT